MISNITTAYLYYFRSVAMNRLRQARIRLKSPRYLLGGLAALAYLVWLGTYFSIPSGTVLVAIYTAFLALAWLGLPFAGGASLSRAMSFKEADVQQLFPAPISRARLLQFNALRLQGQAFIMALVFSIVCRNAEGFSFIYLLPGIYITSNLLNIHGSVLNLIASQLRASGLNLFAWLAAVAVLLGIGYSLWLAVTVGMTDGLPEGGALQLPAIQRLLAPVALIMEPAFAQDPGEFLRSLWFPLGLWLLHALIYFNLRFPFEDEAISQAALAEKFKTEGWSALRKKKKFEVARSNSRLHRLAATGPQWQAIVWKNVISITRLRRGEGRILFLLLAVVLVVGSFLSEELQNAAGLVLLGVSGYSILLGPVLLRVDLRLDIPHFDVLKSMPVGGRQLIFGEIMGPQIVLFSAQLLGFAVAAWFLRGFEGAVSNFLVILLGLPILFGLDLILLTMENLLALYFPSFCRFGTGMSNKASQFGQNLLGMLVRVFTLLLGSIVPALVGVMFYFASLLFVQDNIYLSVLIGSTAAAFAFIAEAFVLIYLAEARYETFDVSAENISAGG